MEYMTSSSTTTTTTGSYTANDSSSTSAPPLIPLQQHQHPPWPLQLPPFPSPGTGLEEAMRLMSLRGQLEGFSMEPKVYYPERPDEPDCTFYMRTGACGFGANCKYNHPPRPRPHFIANQGRAEYPERPEQPECQYYLKTGTCKFGALCKYHHPHDKAGTAGGPQLNALNLPIRPDEKDCAYYLRTGSCKYGMTCKFNHPLPVQVPMPVPGSTAIFPTQIPHMYSGVSSWPMSTRPPYFPSPRIPGPSPNFGPFFIPSSPVPMPSWNPYPVPFAMPEGQHQAMPQGSYVYGPTPQQEPVALSVFSPSFVSGSGTTVRFPTSHNTASREDAVAVYPDRPGQPECQYYMRTGECKYGLQCKYHHPKDRSLHLHSHASTSSTAPFTP